MYPTSTQHYQSWFFFLVHIAVEQEKFYSAEILITIVQHPQHFFRLLWLHNNWYRANTGPLPVLPYFGYLWKCSPYGWVCEKVCTHDGWFFEHSSTNHGYLFGNYTFTLGYKMAIFLSFFSPFLHANVAAGVLNALIQLVGFQRGVPDRFEISKKWTHPGISLQGGTTWWAISRTFSSRQSLP